MSVPERRAMVERPSENLSVRRQCVLLNLARPGVYRPASADAQKLEAAWASLRARNARDYAVATPNGIDEARFRHIDGPGRKPAVLVRVVG